MCTYISSIGARSWKTDKKRELISHRQHLYRRCHGHIRLLLSAYYRAFIKKKKTYTAYEYNRAWTLGLIYECVYIYKMPLRYHTQRAINVGTRVPPRLMDYWFLLRHVTYYRVRSYFVERPTLRPHAQTCSKLVRDDDTTITPRFYSRRSFRYLSLYYENDITAAVCLTTLNEWATWRYLLLLSCSCTHVRTLPELASIKRNSIYRRPSSP